ncbi:hypothetical protein EN866_35435 [Mesorhizobium sp. M2D.F.Ca.ET.223.01.1.1]|uniref:hypothetical protein n=1 Tax=Mesorhizobium sp. M2D.F.Ca.ET.223.01.1.1 TaxID=2563940 RepID=UPI001092A500|nr:hypothetical protein [Mesorhizobium sp. M2D.F.Ca.ET.223.01.1.1]TGR81218.1 hypothetical protein EN866_35435 [Mesorhizobium sp. M2D.F.Ca.ET.223.01.1.1]TGT64153.1 hypothetical protein EN802_33060 [bacterium M00.F.Ca.ET.159.01.1.1]TGT79193.1 hypothetical protein EN800_32405 [bacterium M00.F.Ca.ET.157.01.1.1]
MSTQTQTGFDEARKAIFAGKAKSHALWAILTDEHQRDGYALRPMPWEGSGEYQWVSFDDGRSGFVRLPADKHLPRTA